MAVLLLLMILWILPAGIWMKDPYPDGFPEALTGEIYRIEPREQGQAVYLKNSNISDTGMILVYLDAETKYSIGNTIQITGNYKYVKPEEPANPGQFDARLYYQTKRIVLLCYAAQAVLTDGSVRRFPELMCRIRADLSERCVSLFGERQGGVLMAMLLGDRTELPDEIQGLYQKSGMAHLLAISGLHVSIFGMSLYRLLRKAGCSYKASGFPAMGLVLFYGSLTGMGISTVRAVLMFLLAVTADFLGRSYDMLTALAAAALLLLIEQPLYARSASFLLSFGAVLGIGVLYPAVQSLCPLKRKWVQAFLVSFSIQVFTLPLTLKFYYEIPIYSMFLNLLVIPLMTVLMFGGIAALAVSFFSLKAAVVLAVVCRVVLRIYEWAGNITLCLPGAVQILGRPKEWQIMFYYLGIIIFIIQRNHAVKKKKQITAGWRTRGVSLCVYLILNAILLLRFQSGLTFTMLDVGQGDGLFLRTESGTTCLIDGGSSSVNEVGTYWILPFLKEQGVRKLDYVAVTHTDQDHISGLEELLSLSGIPGEIQIRTLLITGQSQKEEAGKHLTELAQQQGTAVYQIKAGDVLKDASTRISCLHPGKGETYEDPNAGSLVLRIDYGEFSMLLTGDLEEEGEKWILEKYRLDACDILKAGHHGSKTSTSEEWLSAVRPKLTLISCGENNSYGHPHAETLERLEAAGSHILSTPEEGAVTIHSDGKTFWAESFRGR